MDVADPRTARSPGRTCSVELGNRARPGHQRIGLCIQPCGDEDGELSALPGQDAGDDLIAVEIRSVPRGHDDRRGEELKRVVPACCAPRNGPLAIDNATAATVQTSRRVNGRDMRKISPPRALRGLDLYFRGRLHGPCPSPVIKTTSGRDRSTLARIVTSVRRKRATTRPTFSQQTQAFRRHPTFHSGFFDD